MSCVVFLGTSVLGCSCPFGAGVVGIGAGCGVGMIIPGAGGSAQPAGVPTTAWLLPHGSPPQDRLRLPPGEQPAAVLATPIAIASSSREPGIDGATGIAPAVAEFRPKLGEQVRLSTLIRALVVRAAAARRRSRCHTRHTHRPGSQWGRPSWPPRPGPEPESRRPEEPCPPRPSRPTSSTRQLRSRETTSTRVRDVGTGHRPTGRLASVPSDFR